MYNLIEYTGKIKFPVYGYTIHVIFSTDMDLSVKRLQKQKKLGKDFVADQYTGAITIKNDTYWNHCYMLFHMNADSNHVTHECYHAIVALFKWIDADHEKELFPYHLGYLAKEVVRHQKNAREKAQKLIDKETAPVII